MKFEPDQDVALFLKDGTELSARPVYVGFGKDWLLGLMTSDGQMVYCMDEATDNLFLSSTGQRIYTRRPPVGEPVCNTSA